MLAPEPMSLVSGKEAPVLRYRSGGRPPRGPRRLPRFLRRLILLLVVALVVAAGLFVLAANALDPARLKTELQSAVFRATGRTLVVNGAVHLSIGLAPQFEADDVTLSNIPGASRPQMLTAHAVRARLALLPLLSGDAVISSLVIAEPDIILERAADGTPNWQFTAPRRALYQGHGGGGAGGGHHAEIREVTLKDAQLTWQPLAGAARTVSLAEASISAADSDSPLNLSVTGTLPSQSVSPQGGGAGDLPFTLTGSFGSLERLQGENLSALAGAWPVSVHFDAKGLQASLEGGINHPEQMRSYQIRFTLHTDSLATLNVLLPKPDLPPMQGVNITGLLSDTGDGVMRTSQVSFHAERSDLSAVVPGLVIDEAKLSAPGPGQLVQGGIDGTYQDQKLSLAAALMQPDVIASTAPLQLTLSGQAAGASVSIHGTIPPSFDTAGLDLQVDARAPRLAALSPLAGRTLPDANDVAITAELQDAGVKLRGIAVRNFVASSSIGDANGDFTVNWAPRPSLTGTLTSRSLDLDALLGGAPDLSLPQVWPPATGDSGSVTVPQPAPPATPPAPGAAPVAALAAPLGLPLDFLRNHDADLTVNIGVLTAGGTRYNDFAAHLELQDGKLALNPLRAQSSDGTLIGGISIDATTAVPPIAVTLRSPAISAHAVASLLGYPQTGTTGTMQVDAVLSGSGTTLPDLESGLNGHLGLAMVNGALDNALIDGLLGDVLQAQGAPALGDGATQVRCLALRMDFNHGAGTVRALAADTSRLSLSGSGTIDFAQRSVDLRLRPQVRLGPTEMSSAVLLQGDFGALHASLDPAFSNGRVGLQIGGTDNQSGCWTALAVARNGLGGPLPVAAPTPAPDQSIPLIIKKPKDLLKGLFH